MSYTLTPIATNLAKVCAAIGSKDKKLYDKLLARHRKVFKNLDAHYDSFDEDEAEVDVEEVIASFQEFAQEFLNSIPGLLNGGAPAQVQSKRKSKVRWKLDEDRFVQTFEKGLEERFPAVLSQIKRVEKHILSKPVKKPDLAKKQEVSYAHRSRSTPMREALRHLIMGEQYNLHVGFKYARALECICRHFGSALPGDPWTSLQAGADLQWLLEIDEALQSAGVPKKTFRVLGHLAYRGSPIPIPESDSPNVGHLWLEEIKTAQKAFVKAKVDRIKDETVQKGLNEVESWFRFCSKSKRDLICFYG